MNNRPQLSKTHFVYAVGSFGLIDRACRARIKAQAPVKNKISITYHESQNVPMLLKRDFGERLGNGHIPLGFPRFRN